MGDWLKRLKEFFTEQILLSILHSIKFDNTFFEEPTETSKPTTII